MNSVLSTMMLLFVAFAVSTADDAKVTDAKMKEAAMVVVKDCRDQEHATDADIESLKAHKIPASHEGRCMLQCLLNTGKIMQGGKMHKAGALEFFTPAMKGDAGKIKKLEQLVDKCVEETGKIEDPCEVAKVIVECTSLHGKEFGFVFPNHIKS